MKATPLTAALAGAFASAGFLFCRLVQAHQGPFPAPLQWAYWALAATAVGLVPGYLFVVGPGQRSFEKRWFKDPGEASRFMAILNRMVVWFLGATATTLVLSRL